MNIYIPDNNLTTAEMLDVLAQITLAFMDSENIWVDQEGVANIPTNYGNIQITVP